MKTTLALTLIALPFAAVAVVCVRSMGWKETGIVFGITAALVLCIGLGCHLLFE